MCERRNAMKEYVCTVCGYVHKGELPDGFKCPVCGAGKEAFKEVTETSSEIIAEKPTDGADKELTAMEMSVICSNLARGCEKQYLSKEKEQFEELAEFFRKAAGKTGKSNGASALKSLIDKDLRENYPYADSVSAAASDRGAMRSLVWSKKVTNMLSSLLARYEKEGDKMLENTGVYICSVCGFVYVGTEPPELCPVCKVPSWKFEKLQGRAQ